MEYDEIRTEIYKLRSDINSLSSKLVAADYGRNSDTDRVVKEVIALREQTNTLLHHVVPIEELHQKSLRQEEILKKMEIRQRKRDEIRSLVPLEQTRHAWLPVFAIIQLALSWAIFFK